MTSQAHWHCPKCGTFDGPISAGCCDVCADTPWNHVEMLVPKARAQTVTIRITDLPEVQAAFEEAAKTIERLREALGFVKEHAALDASERGVAEAERYFVIAHAALEVTDEH